MKKKISKIWDYSELAPPISYLGMLFFVERLKIQFCNSLIHEIQNKLIGWKEKTLNYTRRLTLIKTILQSIPIYLAMVFKVPIYVCNKIDQIFIRFIQAEVSSSSLFLVAWNLVCIDKMQGGLSLRKMKQVSLTLHGKLIWQQAMGLEKEWVQIIRNKYMMGEDAILRIQNPPYGSTFWNGLISAKLQLVSNISWEVGNGSNIFMWEDIWFMKRPLIYYSQLQEGGRWVQENQGYIIDKYYDKTLKKWFFSKPPNIHQKDQLYKLEHNLNKANLDSQLLGKAQMRNEERRTKYYQRSYLAYDGEHSIRAIEFNLQKDMET